jgi:hypothetical protein
MSNALKLASVLTNDEFEHVWPLLQKYQAARDAAIEERRKAAEPVKQARAQAKQEKLAALFNNSPTVLKLRRSVDWTFSTVECRVIESSETSLKLIGIVDGEYRVITARRNVWEGEPREFSLWVFSPQSLKLSHPDDHWSVRGRSVQDRPLAGVSDLELRKIRSANHPDKFGSSIDTTQFQAAVEELDHRRRSL